MARKPTNHFKSWTPEEVSALKRMLLDGTTPRVIAKQLGRSPGSVTARAKAEKVSRKVQADP